MSNTTFSGPVQVGEPTIAGTTPTGGVIKALDAAGTNVAGTSLTIRGGASTGSGAGGSIVFTTTPAGSSGSTQNSAVTAMTIAGTGLVTLGPTATAGNPVLVRTLTLTPTAAANTDLTLALPACRILRITQRTTTAYTGNTVAITIGSTAGGVDYVASTDIKAKAAARALTLVDAAADTFDNFPAGNLNVRIVQTATVTAVGSGTLVVEYQRL